MDSFPWTFLPVENCATRGGRYRWKTLPSLAFFPGHEKRTKTTSHVQIGGGKNEDLSALLLGMMIDCIVCAFELKKPGGGTINLPIFGNLPLLWGSSRPEVPLWHDSVFLSISYSMCCNNVKISYPPVFLRKRRNDSFCPTAISTLCS